MKRRSLSASRLLTMPKIRVQYHLQKTDDGFNAWSVHRLIDLTQGLPVRMIDPRSIDDFYGNHWYFHNPDKHPSPQSIVEHIQLIQECNLTHPIILGSDGRVMDGMHRICKAVLENAARIAAVQFAVDPEPDYVGVQPDDLPYD